jgi:integrase
MKPQEREKRGGGRPREAEPERNADGSFSVRLTMEVEGETVRKRVHLGTSDRAVAKKRAERLASGEAPDQVVKKGRTFLEVAEHLMAESAIRTKKERLSRLRRYAYPTLGELPPEDVKVQDIKACLSVMENELGWTNSIRHLKNDISFILGSLYSDGELAENAALRIDFKKLKRIVRVTPLRVVLTDQEFTRFIEYGLTLAVGGALPELYMLALSARCLGGMRTSDLHAWRWDHIDTLGWREAQVPRPKTQGPAVFEESGGFVLEPYELPAAFGPYLYGWWQASGGPSEGPVFPVRRGPRAGEHKLPKSNYSAELRDALWAAGVVRPQQPAWELARPEDRRQHCALQAGIVGKRACVDFHSFRRAFVTATTNQKGLSFQESMRLADHSDPTTHMKYMRDENRRVIPGGALPSLPSLAVAPATKALPAPSGGGFWQ